METREQRRERLIKSGAFDKYCKDRNALINEKIEEYASKDETEWLTSEEKEEKAREEVLDNSFKLIDRHENFGLDWQDFNECESMRQTKKGHRKRISDHLDYMVENCPENEVLLWITLQESEEFQAALGPEQRCRKAQRVMKKYCSDYDGNIDYGEKSEREHFHFVASVPQENVTYEYIYYKDSLDRNCKRKVPNVPGLKKEWGSNVTIYPLWKSEKSRGVTSAYMSKLVSHAIKRTAGRRIVARNSPYKKFMQEEKENRDRTERRLKELFGENGVLVFNSPREEAEYYRKQRLIVEYKEEG